MKMYLWETHMHTSQSSRCGQDSAVRMVSAYHKAGYHGLVITDHFVNGYSYGNTNAPWQERIDALLKGYNAAKRMGDKLHMPVLLGWEYPYQGGDYLTYGLDEAFLRDQPDLANLSIDAYVKRVQAAGGLVSQAHPYRAAPYMPKHVAKRWDIVDAIEVFNGSHASTHRQWDLDALALAEKHNLIQTAGSDAHRTKHAGTAALAFSDAFGDAASFLSALRGRQGIVQRTVHEAQ